MVPPAATCDGEQSFTTSTPGWNSWVVYVASAWSLLPNPSTVQSTAAELISGSGSPGCTMCVPLVVSDAAGARLIGLVIPSSGSVSVHVRLGLSADEQLVTLMA